MPERTWDIWHDRAVFHFLVEQDQQERLYRRANCRDETGRNGDHGYIREKCSGLPVQRYGQETLASRLGRAFELTARENETHATPRGTEQRFSYAMFRRR